MKSLKDYDEIEIVLQGDACYDAIGGVSAKVIAKVDGKKVMIKKSDRDTYESFCEYIAHKLGNLMGLKTNEVELIKDGELVGLDGVCSMHTWEEDFVERSGVFQKVEYTFEHQLNEDAIDADHSILRLFDIILDNEDRHGHNWGWLNGELFLIDHETCFPWYPMLDKDVRKLDHHLTNMMSKRLYKTALDFYYIEAEDFYEAFQVPHDVEQQLRDNTVIDKVITRMISIQDHIGKKLGLKQLVA